MSLTFQRNKRIFSGMQPTNALHLGNYLGALRNWVDMQNSQDYDCIFCIVDLHAITMPYNAPDLLKSTRELTAAYIAAGVNPDQVVMFAQSSVPAHSQLMWLLSTMAQMGKLNRMTQFKDKAGKNSEKAGLGLYAYPVLMAADVLLYKATHVPVGEDQKQHIELMRDLASTFNHHYGREFFPLPEYVTKKETARIMSLRDGTKKMSKSDESDYSRINLTDDADTIATKIKKAKTDPEPVPTTLDNAQTRPEALNLLTIYAALSDEPIENTMASFGGQSFSTFKTALADLAVAHLAPLTSKMRDLLAHPDEIDKILAKGTTQARAIADPILRDVQDIMGFKAF